MSKLKCADIFAGTGILSFEALSRGIRKIFINEGDSNLAKQIDRNLRKLNVDDSKFKLTELHYHFYLSLIIREKIRLFFY